MDIGVPKELKDQEYRVGLSPSSTKQLIDQGHQVFIETEAGLKAGFSDSMYQAVGARIVPTADGIWEQNLIVKVKEPLSSEFSYIRKDQILFTYLHLAAGRELTETLLKSGATAIAYELVEVHEGRRRSFPLLTPMSIIAGRLAVQVGAHYLERQRGGRGVLLSGVPGVEPGKVVILGGGVVGTEAAKMALGLGAEVTILDINVDRLGELETLLDGRARLLYSNAHYIEKYVSDADLVIGAVLLPGLRPPVLVSRSLVETMRDGSVIVDVAVDQGGCIETMRVTSHSCPTYIECGVIHYGVPNMPGSVPWTATQALNNSTLPYIVQLANLGSEALERNSVLARGLNVHQHQLMHPALQHEYPDLKPSFSPASLDANAWAPA